MSQLQSTTKQRRPTRSSDIEKHRQEIEIDFCSQKLSVKQIAKKYNELYGWNAKLHQYRDCFARWGCRKNLRLAEYEAIKTVFETSQNNLENSDVMILEGSGIVVPTKRVKRGLDRLGRKNTFTEQLFLEAEKRKSNSTKTMCLGKDELLSGSSAKQMSISVVPKCSTPNVNSIVRQNLPLYEDSIKAYMNKTILLNSSCVEAMFSKRNIPLRFLYSLPTVLICGQVTCALQSPSPSAYILNGRDLDTQHRIFTTNFLVIRRMVYELSNHTSSDFEIADMLLDQLKGTEAREALSFLLCMKNATSRAICETLVYLFHVRQDYDLLEKIRNAHPDISTKPCSVLRLAERLTGVAIDFSDHQHGMRVAHKRMSQKYSYSSFTKTILNQVRHFKSRPGNGHELAALLHTCTVTHNDVSLFFELWDQDRFRIEELEGIYFGRYHCSILLTEDVFILDQLLQAGFRSGQFDMLLRAILRDNKRTTAIILKYTPWTQLQFYLDILQVVGAEEVPGIKTSPVWEYIPLKNFDRIIHTFLKDTFRGLKATNLSKIICRRDIYVRLLSQLFGSRPEMAQYLSKYIARIYWQKLNGHLPFFILWENTEAGLAHPDYIAIDAMIRRDMEVRLGIGSSEVLTLNPRLIWCTTAYLNSLLSIVNSAQLGVEETIPFPSFFRQDTNAFGMKMDAVDQIAADDNAWEANSWLEIYENHRGSLQISWPQMQSTAVFVNTNKWIAQHGDTNEYSGSLERLEWDTDLVIDSDIIFGAIETALKHKSQSKERREAFEALSDAVKRGYHLDTEITHEAWAPHTTPAEVAIYAADTELLGFLLDMGAGTSQKSQEVHLLFRAVEYNLASVKYLYQRGFDVNQAYGRYLNNTALHIAIRAGNMNATVYLLEVGARNDAKNIFGLTPVDYAVEYNRLDTVALMIRLEPWTKDIALKAAEYYKRRAILEYIRELGSATYLEETPFSWNGDFEEFFSNYDV